ncbi:hypothetical protein BNJ_00101 [Kaumoebavirus]|uniref:hypothetical protein n=1 Tax=Kaumoebavirus TaxID=1859492 RepID=UPI0009C1D558|nr:hypothetical protein BNJ_00101 [Kaumoebavirus]ARA71939.1 hypothetical protein BNJ_00101 [Kaumoebavirus]
MRAVMAGTDKFGRPLYQSHVQISDQYLQGMLYGSNEVANGNCYKPKEPVEDTREKFWGDAQIRHGIVRDDPSFDGKNSLGFMRCGPDYCVKN